MRHHFRHPQAMFNKGSLHCDWCSAFCFGITENVEESFRKDTFLLSIDERDIRGQAGAPFQNRSYWDCSALFWIAEDTAPCLRAESKLSSWVDEQHISVGCPINIVPFPKYSQYLTGCPINIVHLASTINCVPQILSLDTYTFNDYLKEVSNSAISPHNRDF
jgi:hypothetical protein